ncbi:hypothetical protein D4764_07G0001530 [Takifugu flavidus]|uniref:Uncharacterized protein n=1 Tax=Takifugu flavidus TaxID=433684 RepID=A0A5C6MQ56_9TELE|nr:hypothetical protein D4764_07G0001530 [Takifugu flavidus]
MEPSEEALNSEDIAAPGPYRAAGACVVLALVPPPLPLTLHQLSGSRREPKSDTRVRLNTALLTGTDGRQDIPENRVVRNRQGRNQENLFPEKRWSFSIQHRINLLISSSLP